MRFRAACGISCYPLPRPEAYSRSCDDQPAVTRFFNIKTTNCAIEIVSEACDALPGSFPASVQVLENAGGLIADRRAIRGYSTVDKWNAYLTVS